MYASHCLETSRSDEAYKLHIECWVPSWVVGFVVVELQKLGLGVESGKELGHVRCPRSERQIFARRLDFINRPPAIPEFFTIWIVCTRTALGSR
jgi:hypothetical protein